MKTGIDLHMVMREMGNKIEEQRLAICCFNIQLHSFPPKFLLYNKNNVSLLSNGYPAVSLNGQTQLYEIHETARAERYWNCLPHWDFGVVLSQTTIAAEHVLTGYNWAVLEPIQPAPSVRIRGVPTVWPPRLETAVNWISRFQLTCVSEIMIYRSACFPTCSKYTKYHRIAQFPNKRYACGCFEINFYCCKMQPVLQNYHSLSLLSDSISVK